MNEGIKKNKKYWRKYKQLKAKGANKQMIGGQKKKIKLRTKT